MKIESLHSGCLKIWMTNTDMRRWGLQFDTMTAGDHATRAAVTKLLHVVRQHENLPLDGAMTVEALPVDGGCLLLITPRRPRPLLPMPQMQIYALGGAEDVLQLGVGLAGKDPRALPASSLYGWGEGYRLILYPGFCSLYDTRRLLSEFAEKVGEGAAAAAFVEEHGTPLAVGDALHRLITAPGSP